MQAKQLILKGSFLWSLIPLCAFSQSKEMAKAGGDRITIHNQTPRDLYAGIYYLRMKLPWEKEYHPAKLASPVQFIESESSGIVQRPPRKVGYDRELVFSEDKNIFNAELSQHEVTKVFRSKNVGDLQGDVFYLGEKEGIVLGYTTIEWNVNKALLDKAREEVLKRLPAMSENPYKNVGARIRVGNELPPAEKNYIAKRVPRVKQAQEKLLNEKVAEPLKIALVISGGGARAMLYTLGILRAFEKSGITNTMLYIVTLSGSTWAVSSWYNSGESIEVFSEWVSGQLPKGITSVSSSDAELIGQGLITKYLCEQPLGPVDLYGSLLANVFLAKAGNKKQRQHLSDQASRIENGQLPLPIYTAVRAESIAVENMWYEFTPYEVGGSWLGMYVPTRAFGAKFSKGELVRTDTPELSLGNLMGIWGFAPGASITRMLQEIGLEEKMPIQFAKNIVMDIDTHIGAYRPLEAKVLNFTRGMPQSPVKDAPFLSLTDAGVSFSNLPYPPVSGERPERAMDILICVDVSDNLLSLDTANLKGPRVPSLKIAEYYAQSHRLPFPSVMYEQITQKGVSLFKGEKGSKAPVIVYLPRIHDRAIMQDLEKKHPELRGLVSQLGSFDIDQCFKAGICSSENFSYQAQQARNLMLLGELNGYGAVEPIIDAMRSVVQQKK